MKLAVTGGQGRIGAAIVSHALAEGHHVVSMDRKAPEISYEVKSVEHHVVDGRDFSALVEVMEGCDALIHCAAIPGPNNHPANEVYNNNTQGSYNALLAAIECGVKRICQLSSVNAIGMGYSRAPRFDYFPLDEAHPTYCEDAYSLSKWVGEEQASCLARRFEDVQIASLRLHLVCPDRAAAVTFYGRKPRPVGTHLWGYTPIDLAVQACFRSLDADFGGHEAFFITERDTFANELSADLARVHFPDVPIAGPFVGCASFFSTAKAEKLLGLKYQKET